ncbi:DUF7341 domain-containing protein [Amycolatopsis vastitatis]|uniref:Uncharacterized protein n=1 Tax=Amycolatopsis vastitatis TaxID=1905142 RepID=A0A229SVN7_9PSEU|nr:hypothetical protein [Amycolatopsis vastitatis]OXM63125.1 hypothetical protein CF165_32730 [Amycolatopsis vastitatis]
MTSTLDTGAREDRVNPVMLRLAFDAAVDQLTQPGLHVVARDNGDLDRATSPCLLDQLAVATQPGHERTGGASPGSRPPASLNALTLVAEISQALRVALAALGYNLFGPGPRTTLTQQVQLWASHAEQWQLEHVDYLAHATREAERWVAAGRAILDPAPTYRLRGHACPTCGHSAVLMWSVTEGEWLRQPALSIDTDRAEAVCAACDSRWGLDFWAQLGQLLEQQQAETLALDCE